MAKHKDPRFYVDITRVDEDQRIIECYGTRGDLKDSFGTFIDLDSAARCMGAYMEYPALRSMHQPIAAGSTVNYEIDDAGIKITAKVVDDNEWNKVRERVYRGLSIGGAQDFTVRDGKNIGRVKPESWKEGDVVHLRTITEYSLVDSPGNRGCGDMAYRIAGMEETMEEENDVTRYAGEEISDVATALNALQSITWLLGYEEDEGSTEVHPEAADQVTQLKAAIVALKTFIASEIKENTTVSTYTPGETSIMELAAGDDSDVLRFAVVGADGIELQPEQIERVKSALTDDIIERLGSRHSSEDLTRLNAIRDKLGELGVTMCERCAGDVQHADGNDDDVQRLATLESDVTRLNGELDTLRAEITTKDDEIKRLGEMPEPAKALITISREMEVIRSAKAERETAEIEAIDSNEDLSDVQRAAALVKIAQRNPIRL